MSQVKVPTLSFRRAWAGADAAIATAAATASNGNGVDRPLHVESPVSLISAKNAGRRKSSHAGRRVAAGSERGREFELAGITMWQRSPSGSKRHVDLGVERTGKVALDHQAAEAAFAPGFDLRAEPLLRANRARRRPRGHAAPR